MLIICPECNKQISDKAVSCPHCGFPLSEANLFKSENKICIIDNKSYDLNNVLKLCLDEKYKSSIASLISITKMTPKNCLNLFEQINVMGCIPDSYTTKEYAKDEEKQAGVAMFQMKDNKTKVNSSKSCPKCGCTEFTPVRKKWSLLTGFATNQVELICNKCGTKIK